MSPLLVVDATVYVGGLDEKMTEALMWELFLQAGPVGKSLTTHPLTSIETDYVYVTLCHLGSECTRTT